MINSVGIDAALKVIGRLVFDLGGVVARHHRGRKFLVMEREREIGDHH